MTDATAAPREPSPELADVLARIMGLDERLRDDGLGSARWRYLTCDDGYLSCWTTERANGGRHHGRFLALLYKPGGSRRPLRQGLQLGAGQRPPLREAPVGEGPRARDAARQTSYTSGD